MSETIKFKIDGKECAGKKGQTIVQAAADNGVYIPVLCYFKEIKPTGACRVCTVKVNGRYLAGCATAVGEGMIVENDTDELSQYRSALIELMFVEGNHFCPACEKSGNCDLQAMGYKFKMLAPRFHYNFPDRKLDASSPKILLERNRCILCKRCVHKVRNRDGKAVFAPANRGNKTYINIDAGLAATLSDKEVQAAMDMCPVGAILKKGAGFNQPIGTRKYDKIPIGSDT